MISIIEEHIFFPYFTDVIIYKYPIALFFFSDYVIVILQLEHPTICKGYQLKMKEFQN